MSNNIKRTFYAEDWSTLEGMRATLKLTKSGERLVWHIEDVRSALESILGQYMSQSQVSEFFEKEGFSLISAEKSAVVIEKK